MENEKIKEKIRYQLLSGPFPYSNECYTIIPEILSRLPAEVLDTLLNEKEIVVMQFDSSFVTQFEPYEFQGITFVIFVSDLFKQKESEIVYTIVHEFAHAFLGHLHCNDNEDPDPERHADELVIKWGFEKELRDSGISYLYGSNNDNLKIINREKKQ